MAELSRRDAQRLLGGLSVAGTLAGCTHRATGPGPAVSGVVPGPTAAPDWTKLAGALRGPLVRPGAAGYVSAARLYNPRFDAGALPAAIARCADPADVATCTRFAAESRVPFALRAGGHSYGGWSSCAGLVVDVSALSTVTVDSAAATARVGAGAVLADIYAALSSKGFALAAGSCPTVGITGLTLGGGVGVLTRAWGLTCDAVRAVEIVTADGTLRQVDAAHDADLFWALRGGGGGSFGAVTAWTLAVRPAPLVQTFYFSWSLARAAEALAGWQRWGPRTDPNLYSTCKLLADPGTGEANVTVSGTWIGPAAALDAQLAPLLAQTPAPAARYVNSLSYARAMLLEAGCSGQDALQCKTSALSPANRQAFAATSSIVAAELPAAAIDVAVAQVHAAMNVRGLIEGGVSFDLLGGAAGPGAPDATAFVHRAALATAQYTATWSDGASAPAPFDSYVRGFRSAMRPWLGDAAYVNYADASISDYARAYWGANLPRLQQVKRRVDPHGLFTFAQSVPNG